MIIEECEHYEAITKQELNKLKAEILHRFNHELSELRICLNGEPNIKLAFGRIQNMERYLKRLED